MPFLPPLNRGAGGTTQAQATPRVPARLLIDLFTLLVYGATTYFTYELAENLTFTTTTILDALTGITDLGDLGSFRGSVSGSRLFFWIRNASVRWGCVAGSPSYRPRGPI